MLLTRRVRHFPPDSEGPCSPVPERLEETRIGVEPRTERRQQTGQEPTDTEYDQQRMRAAMEMSEREREADDPESSEGGGDTHPGESHLLKSTASTSDTRHGTIGRASPVASVTVGNSVVAAVAIVAAVWVAFGRKLMRRSRLANGPWLTKRIGKRVVVTLSDGRFFSEVDGRVETVDAIEAHIREPSGRVLSVPLSAIRSMQEKR
jgi:hypothetical protein